jgi:DNA mismatch repair protein MSH6
MQKKPQQSITAFFAPANVRSSRVQPEPKRKLSETPPNEPKKAKSSSEESVGEDSPPWLREPRDKDKRAPEHPQFDCRTLYIPPEAFRSMTPAKEQFWRMKQEHMDHVLFFKMGKFYELFYMDAEVGHRELGLVWMGTKEPHVGFPEAAFSKYAEKLVHLGYKVCRVEQTETPEQLKERNRSTSGKKAKVVSREIVSVLTKGTLMDPELIGNDHFSYLCCVDEEHDTVGLCLVDCSTSFVLVKQFQDSSTRATLKGILASLNICEFVFLKDRLSPASLAALKSRDSNAILNAVNHESELWTSSAFLDVIKQKNHFGNPDMAEFIQELIALEFFIGISALGASVWYLNKVMRDQEVFGVASFAHRGTFSSGGSQPMVLDGQTLRNLEVFAYFFSL